MNAGPKLSAKGLFGGLTQELKVDLTGLIEEINTKWNCGSVASVTDICDWGRGGAETYIAHGELAFSDGHTERVVGKAFVGWALPPIDQQSRWEARRSLLSKAGIPSPRLYASYPALSIEEYIPDEIKSMAAIQDWEAIQLGSIARILVDHQFAPLTLLSEMRVANRKLVLVDFGSDLRPVSECDTIWADQLKDQLNVSARVEFERGFSQERTLNS